MTLTVDQARALIAQRKAAAQAQAQARPEEAADVAEITQDTSLPPAASMVQSALSPSVSLGATGGIIGGMVGKTSAAVKTGGAVGTAIGTTAEALMRGESPLTLENAKDTAINVGANLAADFGMDKLAAGARALGRKGFRMVAPVKATALEAATIGETLARDAEADVANVLAEGGVPLTPEEIKRATQGVFTAPELVDSGVLDQAEAFAAGSVFGGGKLRDVKALREKTFEAAKTAYKRAVGPFIDDAGKLGKLLTDKVERFMDTTREYTSKLHETVDAAVGNQPVDLVPIRDGLDGAIRTLRKIRGASPDPEGMDSILSSIEALSNKAMPSTNLQTGAVTPGVPFTWREAKQLRTRFRQVAEVAGKKGYGAAATEARTAVKNLTGIMESALDDTVPVDTAGRTMRQLWKRANTRTFQTEKLAERAQLAAVFDLADERNVGAQVLDKLAPRLGNAENIKTTRRLLGGSNSPEWQMLQRWRVEGLLNSHTPEKALKLLTEVQQSGPGPAAYREMLGPKHFPKIRDFLKASAYATTHTTSSPGKFLPRMTEGGFMLALPAAAVVGGGAGAGAMGALAGTWIVSMRQLSKWLTNPKTADMALGLVRKSGPNPFVLRQAGKAIAQSVAEGAIGQDDFVRLPETTTRADFRALGTTPPQRSTNYGGIRG
jgi:hypothetical protein